MHRPMLVKLDAAGVEIERRWFHLGATVWEDAAMSDTLHAVACTRLELEIVAMDVTRLWRFVDDDGTLCSWDEGYLDLDLCDSRATRVVTFDGDNGLGRPVSVRRHVCDRHVLDLVAILTEDGHTAIDVRPLAGEVMFG